MCQLKLKLKIPHDIGKFTGIKTKEKNKIICKMNIYVYISLYIRAI